jgi:D-alanine-D-alanine ligase
LRSFEFESRDHSLLENLKNIALQCWHVFNLKGYARVDFRVDEKGNIYVLEINANPCISPDSGFVAAATQAGMNHMDLIKRIIEDTIS